MVSIIRENDEWREWPFCLDKIPLQTGKSNSSGQLGHTMIGGCYVYLTGYSVKNLAFYVDKQYFNMVILFLRLRVRRELIIRRDGRAVEGTGLENRRCESIRGFESHSLRQLKKHHRPAEVPKRPKGLPC